MEYDCNRLEQLEKENKQLKDTLQFCVEIINQYKALHNKLNVIVNDEAVIRLFALRKQQALHVNMCKYTYFRYISERLKTLF